MLAVATAVAPPVLGGCSGGSAPSASPLRTGTAVPGVGDEAFDSGNPGLYARNGTDGLRIWVFNVTSGTRLDLEKQLAAVVLAKL